MSAHEEADVEHIAPVSYLPTARQAPPPDPEAGGSESAGERDGRDERRASNVAAHQLARRGMSRWELEHVLERRGVDEQTAAAELDRLESVGLLDDAALAVSLVITRHTRKGLGRGAIERELRQRHIDPGVIDDALSELGDDDERERAFELADKRAAQLHSVDEETARRRLSGFLVRRGYGSSVVRDAVEAALEGRGSVRFR